MPCRGPEMSPIRSRSVAAKISSVSNWRQKLNESQKVSKAYNKSRTQANTVDSGIEGDEVKRETLIKQFFDWRLFDEEAEIEKSATADAINFHLEEDSSDASASVRTSDALREIRNIEETVQSGSGESYNSWVDDYQECAFTDAVRTELKRMERVLQCHEAIPIHYDKEEYKLWIKTFPSLNTIGLNASSPSQVNFRSNFLHRGSSTSPNLTVSPLTSPLSFQAEQSTAFSKRRPSVSIKSALRSGQRMTTFAHPKDFAENNTRNPRTVDVELHQCFVQIAPVNVPGRRTTFSGTQKSAKPIVTRYERPNRNNRDWPSIIARNTRANDSANDGHNDDFGSRKKLSRSQPTTTKASEFIVLPPIEAKEVRSMSAATMARNKMTIRLQHPLRPLYESGSAQGCGRFQEELVSSRARRKRSYK